MSKDRFPSRDFSESTEKISREFFSVVRRVNKLSAREILGTSRRASRSARGAPSPRPPPGRERASVRQSVRPPAVELRPIAIAPRISAVIHPPAMSFPAGRASAVPDLATVYRRGVSAARSTGPLDRHARSNERSQRPVASERVAIVSAAVASLRSRVDGEI